MKLVEYVIDSGQISFEIKLVFHYQIKNFKTVHQNSSNFITLQHHIYILPVTLFLSAINCFILHHKYLVRVLMLKGLKLDPFEAFFPLYSSIHLVLSMEESARLQVER